MPRTTIADVAQAAGVSVSTVSRALRGLDRVSPETRERIEQEAKRLHFSFSKSASSLASGKTMRVAVLLPNEISSWFNAHAFEGIYEVMSKAGYDIVPYIVWTQDDLDAFFQNLPGNRNVDAVIVNSFNIVPEEVEKLSNMKVPIVGINIPSINGFNATVSIDDRQAMHVAVEHLFSMGHRRIAYAYETSNDNNQNMVFSAEARLHGLMETAEKRKMTVERIAIRNYEDATNTILNSLLTMDPAPTALYCESDELALPVIYNAMQELVVPRSMPTARPITCLLCR